MQQADYSHHCDNRTVFKWQSKRRAKLKPTGYAKQVDNGIIASDCVCGDTFGGDGDGRNDATPISSTTARSNHLRCDQCSGALCQCNARLKHSRPESITNTEVVMTNISSPPLSNMYIRLFLFVLCLSVISASRFVPIDKPRSYAQYYPPYGQQHDSVNLRTAKSDRQSFRSVDQQFSNRQYLDRTTFFGGEITGIKVLHKQVSTFQLDGNVEPDYKISNEIIVPANSRLEIEPGVRVEFAPQTGITVRGALLANVSSISGGSDRINKPHTNPKHTLSQYTTQYLGNY